MMQDNTKNNPYAQAALEYPTAAAARRESELEELRKNVVTTPADFGCLTGVDRFRYNPHSDIVYTLAHGHGYGLSADYIQRYDRTVKFIEEYDSKFVEDYESKSRGTVAINGENIGPVSEISFRAVPADKGAGLSRYGEIKPIKMEIGPTSLSQCRELIIDDMTERLGVPPRIFDDRDSLDGSLIALQALKSVTPRYAGPTLSEVAEAMEALGNEGKRGADAGKALSEALRAMLRREEFTRYSCHADNQGVLAGVLGLLVVAGAIITTFILAYWG